MSGARSRHLSLPRTVDANTAALVHMLLRHRVDGVTVLDASLTECMTAVAADLLAVSLEGCGGAGRPVIAHLSPGVAAQLGAHPGMRFADPSREDLLAPHSPARGPLPAGYSMSAHS